MVCTKKDTKPYILEHLNNIKLSRSQYIATFIINYGLYIDNMFTLENFVYNFCKQLINVMNSKPSVELNADILMPKYNQIILDTYSESTFLLRQTTKQHQKFHHAWNHIIDHPNMVNNPISRQKKGIISELYNFLFGLTKSQHVKKFKKCSHSDAKPKPTTII